MKTNVHATDGEHLRRSCCALDWLAFVLADVQTGVGPFLVTYLAAARHWQPFDIGVAMSVGSIAGMIAQTPAGWLIDRLRRKRELIAVGSALVALGSFGVMYFQSFCMIVAVEALLGVVGSLFPPSMAGMSLGIVGHSRLDRRIGRNETFNHAGNVVTAALAGGLGYALAQEAIFYVVIAFSLIAIVLVFRIRAADIDFERARGGVSEKDGAAVAGVAELFRDRRITIFIISVVLFHFANAAMLPLIGQRLSEGHPRESPLYMSICIVGAQMVMSLVAAPSGILAKRWGRKAVFTVGLCVLPVRGILYTVTVKPAFLITVQLLDGVAAAIFGVVSVLVVADLTRGTGRFNLTQGAVATATAAGGALSTFAAESIVQHWGYNPAFLTLAVIALGNLVFFRVAMPETLRELPMADRGLCSANPEMKYAKSKIG
ncbi:MAG TPA: MFS transporter [Chthoniobacter sp.]